MSRTKRLALVALAALFLSSCATSRQSWELFDAVPGDPEADGPAVQLLRDEELRFEEESFERVLREVVQVNSVEGLAHADATLEDAGRIEVRARTVHADGTREELDPAHLRRQHLDGSERVSFSFPGARVGDRLEVEWRVRGKARNFVTRRLLGKLPIRQARLRVHAEEGEPRLELHGSDAGILRRGDVAILELARLPAVVEEPLSPHWTLHEPWAVASTGRAGWGDLLGPVAEALAGETSTALPPDDFSVRDRIETTLRIVASRLLPTGPERELGDRRFDEIVASGHASDEERVAVALELLRGLGIRAEAAAIARNGSVAFASDVPRPDALNHLLLRVPAQPGLDEEIWLDPACDYCRPGELPPWSLGAEALLPRQGRAPERRRATGREAPTGRTFVIHEIRLSENGDARVRTRMQAAGWASQELRRSLAFTEPRALDAWSDRFLGSFSGRTAVEWSGLRCDGALCRQEFRFVVPRYAVRSGDRLVLRSSGLSSADLRPFVSHLRRNPVQFGRAVDETEILRIVPPDGWSATGVPSPFARGDETLRMSFSAALRPDRVELSRSLRAREGIFPAAIWATLRDAMRAYERSRDVELTFERR